MADDPKQDPTNDEREPVDRIVNGAKGRRAAETKESR